MILESKKYAVNTLMYSDCKKPVVEMVVWRFDVVDLTDGSYSECLDVCSRPPGLICHWI
jgi:hypothetical protein